MTKEQLIDHLVSIKQTGYGNWDVVFRYYGRHLKIHTSDSTLIDAIRTDEPCCGTTCKQALEVLWHQAKMYYYG